MNNFFWSSGLALILWFGTMTYMFFESMTTVDSLYFTVVTATTVGFGDCKLQKYEYAERVD